MDIQEMVNARIAELRNQSLATNPLISQAPASDRSGRDYVEELAELSGRMDNDLSEIAGRVLEITERVSDDFARLEKDLLDSRLAMLQHVESVLDMTLALKKQAAKVIGEAVAGAGQVGQGINMLFEQRRLSGVEQDASYIASRASMINHGVAYLFRKTQD
ncbi:MAG: hypothetical protein IMZ73_04365 [Chloroflexi bacterium]|nr:hypothetical protein [Chloroflexota bacterium]